MFEKTPVKSEDTTLLTLPKGSELFAQDINGDWVKVTVEQTGKKVTGWVYVNQLILASNTVDHAAAEPFFQQGTDLYRQGNLDSAIAELSKAIRLDPNFSDAYYNRALSYSKKGELDKAIADYTQVIKLKPNDAQA